MTRQKSLDDWQLVAKPRRVKSLLVRCQNGVALKISWVVDLVCYQFLELSQVFIKLSQEISAGLSLFLYPSEVKCFGD